MINMKTFLSDSRGNILKDITDYDMIPNTGEVVVIDKIPYQIKGISTNYDNNTIVMLCVMVSSSSVVHLKNEAI